MPIVPLVPGLSQSTWSPPKNGGELTASARFNDVCSASTGTADINNGDKLLPYGRTGGGDLLKQRTDTGVSAATKKAVLGRHPAPAANFKSGERDQIPKQGIRKSVRVDEKPLCNISTATNRNLILPQKNIAPAVAKNSADEIADLQKKVAELYVLVGKNVAKNDMKSVQKIDCGVDPIFPFLSVEQSTQTSPSCQLCANCKRILNSDSPSVNAVVSMPASNFIRRENASEKLSQRPKFERRPISNHGFDKENIYDGFGDDFLNEGAKFDEYENGDDDAFFAEFDAKNGGGFENFDDDYFNEKQKNVHQRAICDNDQRKKDENTKLRDYQIQNFHREPDVNFSAPQRRAPTSQRLQGMLLREAARNPSLYEEMNKLAMQYLPDDELAAVGGAPNPMQRNHFLHERRRTAPPKKYCPDQMQKFDPVPRVMKATTTTATTSPVGGGVTWTKRQTVTMQQEVSVLPTTVSVTDFMKRHGLV